MLVNKLFKEAFERASSPLSDRQLKAAKAIRNFVKQANKLDGLDIGIADSCSASTDRVSMRVTIDGRESVLPLIVNYNDDDSGRVLVDVGYGAAARIGRDGTEAYDLNNGEHFLPLMKLIIREAATEAASEERGKQFAAALKR